MNKKLLKNIETRQHFYEMILEEKHKNIDAFFHSMEYFFEKIDLKEKTVLEVGSGGGITAIYMAMIGAKKVFSMEPELEGSTTDSYLIQKDRINKLQLKNIELINEDFNTWQNKGKSFDILISRASINHIFESEYHALKHKSTFSNYVRVASKFRECLHPKGVALISDSCRYGFFFQLKKLGIRRPWQRKYSAINWRKHQNPAVWKKIFEEGGFKRIDIKYPLPYKLKKFKGIVNNPLFNYFLKASFIIKAYL